MPTITIAPTGTPGFFEARLGERLLVASSRQPFFAACRELIRLGFDPDEVAEMRHHASAVMSLRARIGTAAGLTVEDSDHGGIRLRRWRPFYSRAVSLPIRKMGPAYTYGQAAE